MWSWAYPINWMDALSMSTGGGGNTLSDYEKVLGKKGAEKFNELYSKFKE